MTTAASRRPTDSRSSRSGPSSRRTAPCCGRSTDPRASRRSNPPSRRSCTDESVARGVPAGERGGTRVAHLNLLIAFAAGVLGFFSPCVVPLIPGYLSFVSGVSLAEMEQADRRQYLGRILGATALFVLGFSLIFTSLGA